MKPSGLFAFLLVIGLLCGPTGTWLMWLIRKTPRTERPKWYRGGVAAAGFTVGPILFWVGIPSLIIGGVGLLTVDLARVLR